jgi:hypothetical protein
MNRTELIAEAKELGLTFDRNINTVKTEVIEAAVNAAMEPKADMTENVLEEMPDEAFIHVGKTEETKQRGRKKSTSGNSIREKIIALGQKGLTKTQIYNELLVEHASLNYRYVVQTLLKERIAVPRQARVFPPKAEIVEVASINQIPVTMDELAEMVC